MATFNPQKARKAVREADARRAMGARRGMKVARWNEFGRPNMQVSRTGFAPQGPRFGAQFQGPRHGVRGGMNKGQNCVAKAPAPRRGACGCGCGCGKAGAEIARPWARGNKAPRPAAPAPQANCLISSSS